MWKAWNKNVLCPVEKEDSKLNIITIKKVSQLNKIWQPWASNGATMLVNSHFTIETSRQIISDIRFVSIPFLVILRTLVRRISCFAPFKIKNEILRFAQNDSLNFWNTLDLHKTYASQPYKKPSLLKLK